MKLFGVLHTPAPEIPVQDNARRSQGVLFCHPFAEEKALSHRILVNFARHLCQAGYPVLRFDYRGCGDSEGEFEAANLRTFLSDMSRAAVVLREEARIETVHLFGLRLGANLAAYASHQVSGQGVLILWEPIVDLSAYFAQFFRMQVLAQHSQGRPVQENRAQLVQQLESGKSIEVLSYMLSSQCFQDFMRMRLGDFTGKEDAGPVLIAAIMNHCRPRRDLERLEKEFQCRARQVRAISIRKRPFWFDPNNVIRELAMWQDHEDLFSQTCEWIQTLEAGSA